MSALDPIGIVLLGSLPEEVSSLAAQSRPRESTSIDWTELVARVRAGDDRAMTQLYLLLNRGIRYFLASKLGPECLEDRLHDTFLDVVKAIQRGNLRDPERLMGLAKTIAKRQVAAHVALAVRKRDEEDVDLVGPYLADGEEDPEDRACRRQIAELTQNVLAGLAPRDREILERFYLREQTDGQICAEMNLTATQFVFQVNVTLLRVSSGPRPFCTISMSSPHSSSRCSRSRRSSQRSML